MEPKVTSYDKNKAMYISNHINVYNTCLRILRSKNYSLRVEGEQDEEESITPESLNWHASKISRW